MVLWKREGKKDCKKKKKDERVTCRGTFQCESREIKAENTLCKWHRCGDGRCSHHLVDHPLR